MEVKPKPRPRTKTDEKTLRGRSVWIDETGEITGKKGARYSEVSTTIPFGTGFITAPTIDKNGDRLSDDEVKQRLKDNQGRDFITGEKLPVFSSQEKAVEYARWRSSTMFDEKAIKEGFPEETFPGLPEDKKEVKEKESLLEKGKDFLDYLVSPSRHGVFKEAQYNKGGALMEEQMQMAFMNEGGLKDDGMDKDPVSGNEVPSGSMSEEVRDNIPAQLSEGEYVVPADVVRYYGVKFFEDLRDRAKMGLAEMEANGRIGGEPVPAGGPVNNEELSPQEMQAIQEMMGMAEGGDIQNPYMQQQLLYSQPRPAPIDDQKDTVVDITNPVQNQMTVQNMAMGGEVKGYAPGGLEQSFLNTGQSAVNRGFVGFPLGATIFPSEKTGQTVLGSTGTQVATTGAIDTAIKNTGTTGADTSLLTTVTLYGPNGEIVTLTLPTDIDRYNLLLSQGYTTEMPVAGEPVVKGGGGDDDKVTTDPNSWMDKFSYDDFGKLGNETSDMLKKAPVGGAIGAFINGSTAAQAAANIIIMEANGQNVDSLKADWKKFVESDLILRNLPEGLINGSEFSKDIVLNNPGMDIGLFKDSKDIFGNDIFKNDNDFNNFMQETAPPGMTYDPSITSTTTNNAGETVTVQGGYTREGSATPTSSPIPPARPPNISGGSGTGSSGGTPSGVSGDDPYDDDTPSYPNTPPPGTSSTSSGSGMTFGNTPVSSNTSNNYSSGSSQANLDKYTADKIASGNFSGGFEKGGLMAVPKKKKKRQPKKGGLAGKK